MNKPTEGVIEIMQSEGSKPFDNTQHKISYDVGSLSFEAIRWLIKHNVQITMLDWNVKLLTTMLPPESINVKTKFVQYNVYEDNDTRIKLARNGKKQTKLFNFFYRLKLTLVGFRHGQRTAVRKETSLLPPIIKISFLNRNIFSDIVFDELLPNPPTTSRLIPYLTYLYQNIQWHIKI